MQIRGRLHGDGRFERPDEMLYAGLALILSGILAMPAVLDRIPQNAYRVLLVLGVGGAVYFFTASTQSVLDEEHFSLTKRK